jgi:hypothetical protein
MTDAPQTEDPMVAALLRERTGYVLHGMSDRVDQVDEQLRLRGVEPPAGEKSASSPSTRATPPKGRRARGSEKA